MTLCELASPPPWEGIAAPRALSGDVRANVSPDALRTEGLALELPAGHEMANLAGRVQAMVAADSEDAGGMATALAIGGLEPLVLAGKAIAAEPTGSATVPEGGNSTMPLAHESAPSCADHPTGQPGNDKNQIRKGCVVNQLPIKTRRELQDAY